MHEESSKVNISTALSVLATVIAGTYSTGALGKTLVTTQSVKASQLTNFIRENEKEADRLAINILVNANITQCNELILKPCKRKAMKVVHLSFYELTH